MNYYLSGSLFMLPLLYYNQCLFNLLYTFIPYSAGLMFLRPRRFWQRMDRECCRTTWTF